MRSWRPSYVTRSWPGHNLEHEIYVVYRRVHLVSLSAARCSAAILTLVVEWVFEESQLNIAPLLERLVWTNKQLLLPDWSQPIRGLPAIQSVTFLRKPDDDVTLTIKAKPDVTLGHLEPGWSTEHLCFGLLAGHFVADRWNRLPLGLSSRFKRKQLFVPLFLPLLSLFEPTQPVHRHCLMVWGN